MPPTSNPRCCMLASLVRRSNATWLTGTWSSGTSLGETIPVTRTFGESHEGASSCRSHPRRSRVIPRSKTTCDHWNVPLGGQSSPLRTLATAAPTRLLQIATTLSDVNNAEEYRDLSSIPSDGNAVGCLADVGEAHQFKEVVLTPDFGGVFLATETQDECLGFIGKSLALLRDTKLCGRWSYEGDQDDPQPVWVKTGREKRCINGFGQAAPLQDSSAKSCFEFVYRSEENTITWEKGAMMKLTQEDLIVGSLRLGGKCIARLASGGIGVGSDKCISFRAVYYPLSPSPLPLWRVRRRKKHQAETIVLPPPIDRPGGSDEIDNKSGHPGLSLRDSTTTGNDAGESPEPDENVDMDEGFELEEEMDTDEDMPPSHDES